MEQKAAACVSRPLHSCPWLRSGYWHSSSFDSFPVQLTDVSNIGLVDAFVPFVAFPDCKQNILFSFCFIQILYK